MAKIYVASSWRNAEQPDVVRVLREAGHEVYDFRNPPDAGRGEVMGGRGTGSGFQWSEIDPAWRNWSAREYRHHLGNPIAQKGYQSDLNGMLWCDICLLVLPCGRSAHLELGWCAGAGKKTVILTRDNEEPELMAKMADGICISMQEVLELVPILARLRKQAHSDIRNRLISRLNDALCEMKPGYDDSITGFNEAFDIVRKAFD